MKFAQQVGDVLYEGSTPYNVPAFFNELTKGLGSIPTLKAEDLKKVVDCVTIVYNARLQEEKKRD